MLAETGSFGRLGDSIPTAWLRHNFQARCVHAETLLVFVESGSAVVVYACHARVMPQIRSWRLFGDLSGAISRLPGALGALSVPKVAPESVPEALGRDLRGL